MSTYAFQTLVTKLDTLIGLLNRLEAKVSRIERCANNLDRVRHGPALGRIKDAAGRGRSLRSIALA